ncbi:hypothetical protein [Companilactobacillus sp.]|uniref:hypothetical protein n=1 Tax=Companilactobacillus sp. TaxID=2767905 RepID=UPI002606106B|nr:hypothetical protein [Companilactobacillus sp.]
MENIKNRWNAFSTAGKTIIIIVLLGIIGGIYYAHSVRINPVGKSYAIKAVDPSHPNSKYQLMDVEFEKDGKLKMTDTDSGDTFTGSTYSYTQKEIDMNMKQEYSETRALFRVTDIKKKSKGTISGNLHFKNEKAVPVEFQQK